MEWPRGAVALNTAPRSSVEWESDKEPTVSSSFWLWTGAPSRHGGSGPGISGPPVSGVICAGRSAEGMFAGAFVGPGRQPISPERSRWYPGAWWFVAWTCRKPWVPACLFLQCVAHAPVFAQTVVWTSLHSW